MECASARWHGRTRGRMGRSRKYKDLHLTGRALEREERIQVSRGGCGYALPLLAGLASQVTRGLTRLLGLHGEPNPRAQSRE